MPNNVATHYRLYPSGWKQFGHYCLHCNKRATRWADNVDLSIDHAKTCKDTQKRLKAREGCYSWFNSKYSDDAKIINS